MEVAIRVPHINCKKIKKNRTVYPPEKRHCYQYKYIEMKPYICLLKLGKYEREREREKANERIREKCGYRVS